MDDFYREKDNLGPGVSDVEREPPKATGLLDSKGRPLGRLQEPVGFRLTRKNTPCQA